ncbi:hypothetical protein R1sor_014061 [Riccia sorocarpa]|uniref:Cyanate hydratase n=1 Tax=Riccia sorocarpa TaxID=122646 RepID=A0ABD3H8C0_9MARC
MALKAKYSLVAELLQAKRESGKTFSQIAEATGLTNVYVAQLFRRQAHLKPSSVEALKKAVPQLTPGMIQQMQEIPLRSYDPDIIQDPTVYRLNEGVMHFAESIKDIINEEFGDGIMSAVGFYCSVEKQKGKEGEDRVVVILNGKYLGHTEQKSADNLASSSSKS